MVDLDTLSIVLTGLALTASILYYTMTLRNADKTRKTQLLLNIKQQMDEPAFWLKMAQISEYEWRDNEEFKELYGFKNNPEVYSNILSILAFYNGIGVLVATDRIDIEFLGMHLGVMPIRVWNKMESVIMEIRKEINPKAYVYFEYLKDETLTRESRIRGKAAYLNDKLKL